MTTKEELNVFLNELKKLGHDPLLGRDNQDARVNLWYVIARIEEAMLKGE